MLQTKYSLVIEKEVVKSAAQRLTNQLWKLIPMRENNENWQRHLESVILELIGLDEILIDLEFLQLLSKLEGLLNKDTSFETYRKTVFESISLVQRLV